MSEPMFPAPDDGAGAVAPAGAAVTEPRSNRTMLLAAGGVAAALVLGGGAFFLMTSGGSDPAPVAASPSTAASTPASSASPAATPKPAPTTVKPKTAVVTTRDPFKPLFVAAVDTGTTGAQATAAPTAAPTAPAVAPAKPVVQVTLTVSKIDTTAQTATISVDGKAYPVGIGALFAKNYVLYSVFNTQCVGVLFGDQSVPVCVNSPATVSP